MKKILLTIFLGMGLSQSAWGHDVSKVEKKARSLSEDIDTIAFEADFEEGSAIDMVLRTKEKHISYTCRNTTNCGRATETRRRDSLYTGIAENTLFKGAREAIKSFDARGDKDTIYKMKVWPIYNPTNDEGYPKEVWVRFQYKKSNRDLKRFYLCHKHSNSAQVFCHRKSRADEEPTL